jgi:hypothetical protein
MDYADPIATATALVTELFPQAHWAILTGSVLTSQRTPGSDLDLVVLLPDNDSEAPHRDSRTFRGWPVELFVHDQATLDHYLTTELPHRRPTLNRMIATGLPVVGQAPEIQARCQAVLAAGPSPLTDAERAHLRYQLTDQLDDLTHATDPGERLMLTATIWTTTALQTLAFNNHWTGTSKWLLRELRDLSPDLATRWLAAYGDPKATAALAQEVLTQSGGPLFSGHRVAGERPSA